MSRRGAVKLDTELVSTGNSASVDLVIWIDPDDVQDLVVTIADDASATSEAHRQQPDIRRDVVGRRFLEAGSVDCFGPETFARRLHDLRPCHHSPCLQTLGERGFICRLAIRYTEACNEKLQAEERRLLVG